MGRLSASSVLLALLLLAGCQKAADTIVQAPVNESGFIDESPQELEEKIRNGDRDAAFRLGAMYHDGQGVRQNFTKALELFQEAGRVGEVRSQYNAGMMFLKGEGVTVDYIAARRWFTQAAESGNARAPYQLGLLYYQGLSVEKNFNTARSYFEQSAKRGMPEAQYNLGIMYIRGEGVAKDPIEGYAWLAVARTYGYAKADEAITKLEQSFTDQMKADGQALAAELSDQVESNKAINQAQTDR